MATEPRRVGLDEILKIMNGTGGIFLMDTGYYLPDGRPAKIIAYVEDADEVKRQLTGKKKPQILWRTDYPTGKARELMQRFKEPEIRNWKGLILYFERVVETEGTLEREADVSYIQ